MKKIILILASAFILGGCNRLDVHQPLSSTRLVFTKANEISQTFVSHRNALNMVNICVRNPARSLIPLRFILKNSTNQVIRLLDFSGGNIDNDDCTRFQFEPVMDSKNQSYTAIIETNIDPLTSKEDEALLRLGLFVEAHGGGDYKEGVASVDGLVTPYDLHFKTLYQQDLASVLKESIGDFFIRLTQDPLFLIIFALLISGIIWKYHKLK